MKREREVAWWIVWVGSMLFHRKTPVLPCSVQKVLHPKFQMLSSIQVVIVHPSESIFFIVHFVLSFSIIKVCCIDAFTISDGYRCSGRGGIIMVAACSFFLQNRWFNKLRSFCLWLTPPSLVLLPRCRNKNGSSPWWHRFWILGAMVTNYSDTLLFCNSQYIYPFAWGCLFWLYL